MILVLYQFFYLLLATDNDISFISVFLPIIVNKQRCQFLYQFFYILSATENNIFSYAVEMLGDAWRCGGDACCQ